MTAFDAKRALDLMGLGLKYRRCWLVGRRHGPVFAVIAVLPTLAALEEWLEAR